MNRIDPKVLTPPLTEARLGRQYDAIQRRVGAAPRGRGRAWPAWAIAATATVALAVVVIVGMRRGAAPTGGPMEGAVLEAGPGAGVGVTLADGSRLDLAAGARARVTAARATAVRLEVERGAVEVEATHVEGRTFVVSAGPFEVHVVGTHFVVERRPGERVTVRVDRGVVEIAGTPGEPRRLMAGEQWSAPDPTGPTVGASTAMLGPGASAGGAAPVVSAAPAGATTAAAGATGGTGAMPSSPAIVPTGPAAGAPLTPTPATAKELFDEAQRARAEGRALDAARAFDKLRRTFPRDKRAALATFELGRLRLDSLGDPRGAEEAFREAMALGPRSPFREDAEARRVEALARMGDGAGCTAARDAYLARWPNGTYRRAVGLYCGGP
jgi:TolA-binding protein